MRTGVTTLTAIFVKKTIAWRDLKALTSNGSDRSNFHLLPSFFEFPRNIHEEFARGFADVAVTPRWADNERNRWARIAFPVVHANLAFARQLEQLLNGLGTEPQFLEGSPRTGRGTREHRIRMRAEKYQRIGFHFPHKQAVLDVFASHNRNLDDGS